MQTNSGSEKMNGQVVQFFDGVICSVVNLIQDLPVNIKFVIEGMEEAGSVGLEELVRKEKDRFFSSVDYIVISDNLWLSQRKPALTYGTRGNSYFTVEVFASPVLCRGESVLGSWWEERKLLGERSSDLEAWPGVPEISELGDSGSLPTGVVVLRAFFRRERIQGFVTCKTERFRDHGRGVWG